MFQKVHQRQVNALKKTEVVREMSRSLNRQVLLLRLSAVSHCKDWFPVIYSSARLSFHSWGLTWVFGLKFSRNRWVVPKLETAVCLRSSSVPILCSRTRTWRLEELRPLCQGNTLRKMCPNPRPQMLSSYSSLLSKVSRFILGLSRSFSVVAEWAAQEPGLLPGLRAAGLSHGMRVLPVDKRAVQASCLTQQAGPQPRELPADGKILKDWAGHRVRETCIGGWGDCNIEEGVGWQLIWSSVLTV